MKQVIARKSKIYYLYIGTGIFFALFGIFLIYMTSWFAQIDRSQPLQIFLMIGLDLITFGAAFTFIFLTVRIVQAPNEMIVLEGDILYCYYDKKMTPIPLAEIFSANYRRYYNRSYYSVINIQCKNGRVLTLHWISDIPGVIQRINTILQQYWYSSGQQAAQTARPSNS